jgi:hypothetical protein
MTCDHWTSRQVTGVPVSVEVVEWIYRPFAPEAVLNRFCGSGLLLAARAFGSHAIGIEIEERYC